jgi:uncharacterized protein YndB with AHSA1/START domain
MSVTDVQKDPQALTMTVTAEYEVSVERAWELFNDPRQLERWWGPPTYPATVVDHDLIPGGAMSYYMTSPEGEKYHGWWRVLAADAPRHLLIEDGFADDLGQPQSGMPVTIMSVDIAERTGGGVTITLVSTFSSLEAMEQLLTMGMEEGLMAAMGQIDAILD